MVPLWFVGIGLLAGVLFGMLLAAMCVVSGRCEDAAQEFGRWDGDC